MSPIWKSTRILKGKKPRMYVAHCCCLILLTQVQIIQALSISSKNNNNQQLTTSQHQAPGALKSNSQRHEKSAHDLSGVDSQLLQHRPISQPLNQRDSYQQHQVTTSLPTLMMTTASQYNNIADSLLSLSKLEAQKQQMENSQAATSNNNNHRRSFNYNQMLNEELQEDSDSDANPLQTVNNHSGGSINKAPQYVDVSNLVGVSWQT